MTGKPESPPNVLFLLDESLSPSVAKAFQLVGYNFQVVHKGDPDPEIIEWCQENDAVWVHADDRSRRQHRVALQASGIRTIWVYRTKGRMSGKEQLRILAFVLPHFLNAIAKNPTVRHYRASAPNELAKPVLKTYDP